MGCSSGYKHGVAHALQNAVALHSVLLVKPFPEGAVQVPGLVVDGVVMRFQFVSAGDGHFVQQVADFVGIPVEEELDIFS